ncbi:acyl-CoA desaturase [soil metagenome]
MVCPMTTLASTRQGPAAPAALAARADADAARVLTAAAGASCAEAQPGCAVLPPASLTVRIVTLCAVLLPLLGLAAAIVLLSHTPFYWQHLMIFGIMYAATTLGIGVGFHRLFTHRSYETGGVMRLVWAVLGSMAVEGPLFTWVAVHRTHHRHTDAPGDPHSPHGHGDDDDHAAGVLPLLRGLWHAHVGWLFNAHPPELERQIPDLHKDPVARFVDRTFVVWVVLGLVIPAALGGIITRSWSGVLVGFLWGGLARVLVVHHITWSINSVCHLWGARPFATGDESRDNPVLGILALGEGWHNTHHAFPASARHGLAWWKLDVNYLVIRAMALLRLARNVRVPTAERIAAKRAGRGELGDEMG